MTDPIKLAEEVVRDHADRNSVGLSGCPLCKEGPCTELRLAKALLEAVIPLPEWGTPPLSKSRACPACIMEPIDGACSKHNPRAIPR